MAESRCDRRENSTHVGIQRPSLESSGATPDLTPTPLLNTPSDRSIHMQNIADQPSARALLGGVA